MVNIKPDVAKAFAVLGADPQAPPDLIHQQYRKLVKRWHPDQFAQNPSDQSYAEARLKLINHAYGIVKAYLKTRPAQPSPTGQARPSAGRPFTRQETFFNGVFGRATAHRSGPSRPQPERPASRPPFGAQPPFDQILQKVHGHHRVFKTVPQAPGQSAKQSKRPVLHPRRKRGAMRIEPMEPFSRVQPISPISPIGEDD